uniref:Thymidine kinase n=1 Tax=uncultured bacterium 282 TaxID=698388 RepID=E3T640_9BACT|nr:thymidine kinase [uncultured bacterium 282]
MKLIDPGLKVSPAASFIEARRSYDDQFLALAQSLCVDSGGSTDHAYCGELGDLVRDRHKIGNRAKGFGGEGGIQSRHHDTFAQMNQLDSERNDVIGEKLHLVDANNFYLIDLREEYGAEIFDCRDRRGVVGLRAVTSDGCAVVAEIDIGLVAGNPLAGDTGSLETANEFFGLTGKHGPGDQLEAAWRIIHGLWLS